MTDPRPPPARDDPDSGKSQPAHKQRGRHARTANESGLTITQFARPGLKPHGFSLKPTPRGTT